MSSDVVLLIRVDRSPALGDETGSDSEIACANGLIFVEAVAEKRLSDLVSGSPVANSTSAWEATSGGPGSPGVPVARRIQTSQSGASAPDPMVSVCDKDIVRDCSVRPKENDGIDSPSAEKF
jgi:hypothetical protein